MSGNGFIRKYYSCVTVDLIVLDFLLLLILLVLLQVIIYSYHSSIPEKKEGMIEDNDNMEYYNVFVGFELSVNMFKTR